MTEKEAEELITQIAQERINIEQQEPPRREALRQKRIEQHMLNFAINRAFAKYLVAREEAAAREARVLDPHRIIGPGTY